MPEEENILNGKNKEESAQADLFAIRNLTVTSDWTHVQMTIQ